jgi:hypothetical protein
MENGHREIDDSTKEFFNNLLQNAEDSMHDVNPDDASTTRDFDELYTSSDLGDETVRLMFTPNIAAIMTPREARRLSQSLKRHAERIEEDA